MSMTLQAPFDAHVHFRQGPEMPEYVLMTARQCVGAIAMPNTTPPLTTPGQCREYLDRIAEIVRTGLPNLDFRPYMFAYLEHDARVDAVREVLADARVLGLKLYPKAGTTNSDHGVPEDLIRNPTVRFLDVIKTIEENAGTLSIHGEMPSAFLLDRERQFLKSGFLDKVFSIAPNIRVTLEHISTAEAVQYVREQRKSKRKISATITWHHMIHDVGDVVGRPHNFCRPCPSLPTDRSAVSAAAVLGEDGFMLGSDSAPHQLSSKHTDCCSAGCYTSPTLFEELVEYFYKTKFCSSFSEPWTSRLAKFTHDNAVRWYEITDKGPNRTLVMEECDSVPTDVPTHPDAARWYRYPRLRWKIAGNGRSGTEVYGLLR